jgi:hypothetical protein
VVLRAKLQVAGNLGRGDVVEDEARGAQERAEILQGDLEARRKRGPGRRGGGLRAIALSLRSAALEHYLGVVLDELPRALGQQQLDRVLHVTAFEQTRRDVKEIPVRLPGALVEGVP